MSRPEPSSLTDWLGGGAAGRRIATADGALLLDEIVSATSLAQLSDILGAVRVKLTAEDLAALDKASAPEAVGA